MQQHRIAEAINALYIYMHDVIMFTGWICHVHEMYDAQSCIHRCMIYTALFHIRCIIFILCDIQHISCNATMYAMHGRMRVLMHAGVYVMYEVILCV